MPAQQHVPHGEIGSEKDAVGERLKIIMKTGRAVTDLANQTRSTLPEVLQLAQSNIYKLPNRRTIQFIYPELIDPDAIEATFILGFPHEARLPQGGSVNLEMQAVVRYSRQTDPLDPKIPLDRQTLDIDIHEANTISDEAAEKGTTYHFELDSNGKHVYEGPKENPYGVEPLRTALVFLEDMTPGELYEEQ